MTKISEAADPVPSDAGAGPSDDSLMRQWRQGNQEAASQLYARYADRLQALAHSKCSTNLTRRVDVEDIVQSVFRTFFRGVSQGYYDVPAGDDLWKLLIIIALNKIRAKGKFHQATKRDIRQTLPIESVQVDLETETSGHFQVALQEALQLLDERQREMVELRLQGHDIVEIATLTGRSKRTVERILQEARSQLSNLLGMNQ
jgi:RNA polymerase sigma-70 factor (ECF subfamily)